MLRELRDVGLPEEPAARARPTIVLRQGYAWQLMYIRAPSLPVRPTCGGRC